MSDSETTETIPSENGESNDRDDAIKGHPYVGKYVRILRGNHAGLEGKVLETRERGWMTIDHPDLAGKSVSSGSCEFIDGYPEEEMMAYITSHGKNVPAKLRKVHGWSKTGLASADGKQNNSFQFAASGALDASQMEKTVPVKRRKTSTGRTLTSSQVSISVVPNASLRLDDLVNSHTGTQSDRGIKNVQCAVPQNLCYHRAQHWKIPPLPPVVLESSRTNPTIASLRHLNPESKVDVFNRKTGRIMCGDEAVRVKDLPDLLLTHAEYEPIVPPSLKLGLSKRSIPVREGRSAGNVRVRETVSPQDALQAGNKNRSVMITRGPYRGSVGRVKTCIPGGFYVVEGVLSDGRDLPLVVGANQLELLPENPQPENHDRNRHTADLERSKDGDEDKKADSELESMIQGKLSESFGREIQALQLQVDALSEEEENIQSELIRIESGTTNEESLVTLSLRRIELRVRLNKVKELKAEAENKLSERSRLLGLPLFTLPDA